MLDRLFVGPVLRFLGRTAYLFENFAFSDWVYKSLMTSLLALALPRNSLAVISRNPPFSTTQTALHSAQMKLSPSLRVRRSLIGRGWSIQAISAWHLGQFIGLGGDHRTSD